MKLLALSFALILAVLISLSAQSIKANGSGSSAPLVEPRPANQQNQSNAKQADAQPRALPIQQTSDSKSAQSKATNSQEQATDITKQNDKETLIDWVLTKIASILKNPNWIQVIALIFTIGVMILTMVKQSRAYVFVDRIEFVQTPPNHPAGLDAHIHVRNFGKTPAYNLSCFAVIIHSPPMRGVTFIPPQNPPRLDGFSVDLGPGAGTPVIIHGASNLPIITGLQASGQVLYINGYIIYRHAFPYVVFWKNKRTDFLYMFRGQGHQWEMCPHNNHAT